MRRKAELPTGAAYAPFFEAIVKFCRTWPEPEDLRKLAIEPDETGHLLVGAQETLQTLLRAALHPEDLRQDKGDQEFRRFFGVLYSRSPDFVLALLLHLRQLERRAGPIRKFFRKAKADALDKEIAAMIGNVEADTVKKERQTLTKAAASFSKKRAQSQAALEKKWEKNQRE